MSAAAPSPLEAQIASWRSFVRRRQAVSGADADELEGHLRDHIASLGELGLSDDEAFLVAVKRLGSVDGLAREFALEHADRLWRHLVIASAEAGSSARSAEPQVVFGLAAAAASAIKAPALFGIPMDGAGESFYARNLALFVLPLLAAYFAWKRRPDAATLRALAVPFLLAMACANLYPFAPGSHTAVLLAVHLPIALWLVIGVAYAGGRWFSGHARMDFVRFSGEFAIYYALIAFGGVVLTMLTMMMFKSISLDAGWLAQRWLVPCGAMAAVIVAAWLVEAKQSVIENMAPVLTRLFTPLLTAVLLAFLGTLVWTGRPFDIAREVLIIFDLVLALVAGLVLYAASAREREAPPDLFDWLLLLLIASALLVDVAALAAIASRISQSGITPNRTAALGENLLLMVGLARCAVLQLSFLRGRGSFAALEAWQVAWLPAYALWAAAVAVAFPPLFGFR